MTELRAGASSDTGQIRKNNQDTSLIADEDGLWAVADGMGGHRGGEVASAIAVDALREAFAGGLPTEQGLLDAAAAANIAVHDAAEEDPDLRGMGTTLVAVAPPRTTTSPSSTSATAASTCCATASSIS